MGTFNLTAGVLRGNKSVSNAVFQSVLGGITMLLLSFHAFLIQAGHKNYTSDVDMLLRTLEGCSLQHVLCGSYCVFYRLYTDLYVLSGWPIIVSAFLSYNFYGDYKEE